MFGKNWPMRTPTKFVSPLSDEKRQRLTEIHKTDSSWRARAILHLSWFCFYWEDHRAEDPYHSLRRITEGTP
jgi:hypothetical protein